MKTTIICFTRFHLYDQAGQLEKNGFLHQLITNYPKFKTREFGVPNNKVYSSLYTGIIVQLIKKYGKFLPKKFISKLKKHLHNHFSASAVKYVDKNTDILIGLSSFSLESIKFCKHNNIITISDHGSAHQKYESDILTQERKKFNLDTNALSNQWIIEKQKKEFDSCDYIFLGSYYARDTFLKYGYAKEKLIVNNYGVDLSNFKKVGKNDNIFRVITVASATLSKGIHYLFKAFNELNLKNAELWVVGGGYPNSDLDKIFKKMNINFNNIFFKGYFPQNELYKYYSQCSVFCLPSLSDGFGMVVPQALSCGLPAIVSENTGAKDIIVDDENGYIVPIKNIKSIKEKVLYLYDNPKQLKQMSSNAIESVKQGLTWDDYGNRLVKILESINKSKR